MVESESVGTSELQLGKILEEDGLTENQEAILAHYWETFNIFKACEMVGVQRNYIYSALNSKTETPFQRAYAKMTQQLENDPRIGKIGGIENLRDIAKRAKDAGRMDIEIAAQKEINKMIDRNLAVQKKSVENITIDIKGSLDLTAPKELGEHIIDTEYEDYAEED